MKKLFKIKSFALLIVILSIFLSGCPGGQQTGNNGGGNTLKIGAILPLTGSASENGEFQKQGIELAVEEINAAGGIKGKNLEIVYGDSKNEAKEGISIFTRFSDVDKLPVTIGTMSGIVAPLTAFVAGQQQHNTVLFATVASAPGLAKKSDWVYRSFITSDIEAAKAADFAFKETGVRKMAVMYVNDDYGLGGYEVFKSEFEKLGGQIIFAEPFEKGASDFRTSILKMKSQNPDGVYTVGYDKSYATVIKQIGEAQVNAKMFTTASLSVPSWMQLAGDAANNYYLTNSLYGTDSTDAAAAKFTEAYKRKYNREPNYVSAVTYTIIKMLAAAIEKNDYTTEGIRKGLTETQNFSSIVGNLSFDKDREASMPVRMMRIEGGKILPIQPPAAAAK